MRQKLEIFCLEYNVNRAVEVRDINDADIVRLAVGQQAIIVTNDKDLLEYKSNAATPILSVQEYLEIFEIAAETL